MSARQTRSDAWLDLASFTCRCLVVCICAVGCNGPHFADGTRAGSVLQPADRINTRRESQTPSASQEPGLLPRDPQIARLPPVMSDAPAAPNGEVRLASAQLRQPGEMPAKENLPLPKPIPQLADRLKIPSELPGASAPPFRIPSREVASPAERDEIIEELFPNRPALPKLAPQPGGPTTLKQLENLALANSPEMVQASADVTSAMGAAIQAGVHPNPTLGYEADTVGSLGTRNYQGVYGTQLIKTAGKLGLARAVANVDLMNAQLDLRRTRFDLLSRVKGAYYAVLVAQKNVAISSALAWFTNEAYLIQRDNLRAGQAAAYEPAQLRSLAVQARAAQVQAQNQYVSAWKQLAALIGLPDMPTAELEGRADMPIATINYETMLSRVLNNHPDVIVARNLEAQARLQLQLQRTTPIPDVQMYGTFQRDFTTPNAPRTTYNVQFGLPLPIFDRNRGNILNAEGGLRRAAEQARRVRNELTSRVADAYGRFETARYLARSYQDQILPDLARSYRGVYERHQQEPGEVGFSDIVVAQQNLAVGLVTYISALTDQWSALADIASLMQVEDFSELRADLAPDVQLEPQAR